jgi:predicted RecA/RadA family phage recombinase
MAKNYVSDGETIQWTNGTGAAVTSGQLVKVGPNMLGVALVSIPNGGTGSVAVEGVFSGIPKVNGTAFAQGEILTWKAATSSFDGKNATGATGDVKGGAIAWEAAAAAATTCTIRLTPGNAQAF